MSNRRFHLVVTLSIRQPSWKWYAFSVLDVSCYLNYNMRINDQIALPRVRLFRWKRRPPHFLYTSYFARAPFDIQKGAWNFFEEKKKKKKKKNPFTRCWDLKKTNNKKNFTYLRSRPKGVKKKLRCRRQRRKKIQPDPENQWRSGNFWRKKPSPTSKTKKKKERKKERKKKTKKEEKDKEKVKKTSSIWGVKKKKKKNYPTPTSMPPENQMVHP